MPAPRASATKSARAVFETTSRSGRLRRSASGSPATATSIPSTTSAT